MMATLIYSYVHEKLSTMQQWEKVMLSLVKKNRDCYKISSATLKNPLLVSQAFIAILYLTLLLCSILEMLSGIHLGYSFFGGKLKCLGGSGIILGRSLIMRKFWAESSAVLGGQASPLPPLDKSLRKSTL